MGFELRKVDAWNQTFFEQFVGVRNRLYAGEPYFLKESEADLIPLLHPQSSLAKHLQWRAVILLDSSSQACGRCLVTVDRSSNGNCCYIGFFECPNELTAANLLFDQADIFARQQGAQFLKGPIDGHFYRGYRFKVSGTGKPFYGEPYHKPYYPKLFTQCGMQEHGRWVTIRSLPEAFVRQLETVANAKPINHELQLQSAQKLDWDTSLRMLHGLLEETFRQMPEFQSLAFDEFRSLTQGMHYIVDQKGVAFAHFQNHPAAFLVTYKDPLPVLLWRQQVKEKLLAKPFGHLIDMLCLARLRLGRGRLLVPYTGKNSRLLPRHLGGVGGHLGIFLKAWITNPRNLECLLCFMAEDSKSHAYMSASDDVHGVYAMYQKNLQGDHHGSISKH